MILNLPSTDPRQLDPLFYPHLPPRAHDAIRNIWPYVRTHFKHGYYSDVYVIRLSNEMSIPIAVRTILYDMKFCAHIQICFSILATLLEESGSLSYKAFYGSRNFSLPMHFVTSFTQFEAIVEYFNSDDFFEEVLDILPSTKYIFHSFLGICVFVSKSGQLLV